MKTNKTTALEGFKAVDFVRKVRSQINKETQNMTFFELKKYFENKTALNMAIS